MVSYKIEIKKSATKEIEKLQKKDLLRVVEAIKELGFTPRPEGSIKLSGEEKYRIRVGNFRVLYKIEDEIVTVFIVKVGT